MHEGFSCCVNQERLWKDPNNIKAFEGNESEKHVQKLWTCQLTNTIIALIASLPMTSKESKQKCLFGDTGLGGTHHAILLKSNARGMSNILHPCNRMKALLQLWGRFIQAVIWGGNQKSTRVWGGAIINQNITRVQTERHITGFWRRVSKCGPKHPHILKRKRHSYRDEISIKGNWLSSNKCWAAKRQKVCLVSLMITPRLR